MTLQEALVRLRAAVKSSEMTFEEIGLKMGYSPASARQGVWRLLNEPNDPSLSRLLQLADVLGISLSRILESDRKRSIRKGIRRRTVMPPGKDA